jgi:uncharacterized ion transporter superfamily protein YfcC
MNWSKKESSKCPIVRHHFLYRIGHGVLNFIVPAGEYARVEDPNTGRTVVDPASYEQVEQNPITFFELWKTIPEGWWPERRSYSLCL